MSLDDMTGDDILAIGYAAVQGEPNPIEGELAQRIYDGIRQQIEEDPGMALDVPRVE